jgi:hypothetical protein
MMILRHGCSQSAHGPDSWLFRLCLAASGNLHPIHPEHHPHQSQPHHSVITSPILPLSEWSPSADPPINTSLNLLSCFAFVGLAPPILVDRVLSPPGCRRILPGTRAFPRPSLSSRLDAAGAVPLERPVGDSCRSSRSSLLRTKLITRVRRHSNHSHVPSRALPSFLSFHLALGLS